MQIFARALVSVALTVLLAVAGPACSSDSDTSSSAPFIKGADVEGEARKGPDGKYVAHVAISASDDSKIVSARIDFPSTGPAQIVGAEVSLGVQELNGASIEFRIDAAAGPGTSDANLVMTDDSGNVAKKKILITMTD